MLRSYDASIRAHRKLSPQVVMMLGGACSAVVPRFGGPEGDHVCE